MRRKSKAAKYADAIEEALERTVAGLDSEDGGCPVCHVNNLRDGDDCRKCPLCVHDILFHDGCLRTRARVAQGHRPSILRVRVIIRKLRAGTWKQGRDRA